jgi:predicted nucleic acid-binding protein
MKWIITSSTHLNCKNGFAALAQSAGGIALSRKLVLLTRNHRDFSKVAGLLIED